MTLPFINTHMEAGSIQHNGMTRSTRERYDVTEGSSTYSIVGMLVS